METENKTKRVYGILNLGLLILLAILFIVVYTLILQRNYSYNTLKMEVETDITRSDAIYETICNNLTEEDYTEINTVADILFTENCGYDLGTYFYSLLSGEIRR